MEGNLYLVATPIGNLDDISFRALQVLKDVDIIAAEDTRHTKNLLNHFEIKTPLTSYFEHNKRVKGEYILSLLRQGKSVAVVSDAGMPGISDPGEDIVREAVSAGIEVLPVPGPSASIAALVVSGLPTGRFVFEGFLPRGKKERRKRLDFLCRENRTMIFYEAPHRLNETLDDLARFFGERQASVAREITKKFEDTVRGTLPEVKEYFLKNTPRGEFTLVIAGAPEKVPEAPDENQIREEILKLISTGMSKKEAVQKVSLLCRMPKNIVYKIALELGK